MKTPVTGLAVMYHYVRNPNAKQLSGIRPFSTDEFEAQLNWLAERFDIVTPEQFAKILSGELTLQRRFCLLTFDDGTKDHAQIVTPLLARRGLSGLFFLLSGPWVDRKLPGAHRVHVLLSLLEEERLWNAIYSEVSAEMGPVDAHSVMGTPEDARRIYNYEDSLFRMRIKYAVNFALPADVSERVMGAVVSKELGDEGALVDEWFITPNEAREMQAAGMVIGAHGHSHTSLAQLSCAQLEAEIKDCHRTLSDVLGQAPSWFAYPFGGSTEHSSVLEHGDQILIRSGYRGSFSYSSSPQAWLTVEPNRFARFDRYDCAYLPPRGTKLLTNYG